MAMPVFTDKTKLPASDLRSVVQHLQGASGKTDAWHFRVSSGNNLLITLADAAGATKVSFRDSAEVEVFSIDSNGAVTGLSFTSSTFTFPTSAAPSQTTDGQAVWDSNDDRLTVGTGSGTKTIGLHVATGDASATQDLKYDTTASALKVWNGSASVTIGNLDSVRNAFRANRRVTSWYACTPNTAAGTDSPVGIGLWQNVSGASDVPTLLAASGELYMLFGTAASASDIGIYPNASLDSARPDGSWRFLFRVLLPAASANVTYWTAGLGGVGATNDMAGIRIVTTGNPHFVTRQGGSETTTDLGALSRAVLLGFEVETADAGVTWVCRNQAGTTLATHTTNVPTANSAEESGIYYTYATSTIPMGVAMWYAEGTWS